MRCILFSFLLICSVSNAQQVALSVGASVSTIDCVKLPGPGWGFQAYKQPIISPSAAIFYESPIWKRLSLSAVGSFFMAGGKDSHQGLVTGRLSFSNYTLGIIPNFYMLNKQSKLYIGAGPRFDYRNGLTNDGDYSRFGLSACIGYNYHFEHFFMGVRANYYHQFTSIKYSEIYEIAPGASTPSYFHVTVKDYTSDLQLVFGYKFGKKKKSE